MQEKMKTVLIPRGRKNEENFVLVSVNGRNFKIMKGVLQHLRHKLRHLYLHYVEAQIHYANGEMERYNNDCAACNNALLTYRDFWCRSHMPRQGVKALRLM